METSSTQPIDDIIEEAGYGRFQIYVLILAYGVWFCDGVELAFGTVLTPSISEELNISDSQRAFVVSEVFIGLMAGNSLGGYLGDNVGRRLPILVSYLSIVFCSIGCAFTTNFFAFAIMRLLLGLSMGLGMPPSLALVNETTPKAWKPILFGLRGIVFSLGYLFAISLILVDDRTMLGLHWRTALVLGALPPLLLGMFANFWLNESPQLLAKKGRSLEAANVLNSLLRQNGCSPTVAPDHVVDNLDVLRMSSLQNVESAPCSDAQTIAPSSLKSSWAQQLKIVFEPQYRFTTFLLLFGSCTFNLVEYGTAYAEPNVLQETHASIAPGWQLFTKYLIALVSRAVVIIPALLLSRRVSLLLAYLVTMASLLVFAWTGGIDERVKLHGLLYYLSQYLQPSGVALMALMLYYLSVDSYPTIAAATGGAICVGGGRMGSMIAPFLFEWLPGTWASLYYFMAALCAISSALVLSHPDLEPSKERQPLLSK